VKSIPPISKKFEKPVFKAPAQELPDMGAFLSQTDTAGRFGSWKLMAVIAAVALIVGVIAVPWGWYARSKAAKLANEVQTVAKQNSQPAPEPATANESPAAPVASNSVVPETASEVGDLAAKRAREARLKERAAKAQETLTSSPPAQSTPAAVNPAIAKTQSSPTAGARKATVQVTYDENGRVTQASGGDATALRIARQKRFPAGKAGSATITIPIN
jgi:outer membrane murein-binding lipoprotein Lpp